jgi:hypothetical protein
MALTEFQRSVCRLIASHRRANGESYIAGGTALTVATGSSRISRDIDLFHDTTAAVAASSREDRHLLTNGGLGVDVIHERDGFVEAIVGNGIETVAMQWSRDSAFRFFPLVEHDDFGLALHPFDLATNKVLALVGRLEARDWIDMIDCHTQIQHLGFLAWASTAKDPGFSPSAILEQAAQSSRYSKEEINALVFDGPTPDAAELSRSWHAMLNEARELIQILPPENVGTCLLNLDGKLFGGGKAELPAALRAGSVHFHRGTVRGAYPRFVTKN